MEQNFGVEKGPQEGMEKLREFMRQKQREIFSADPERGDGDFGSTVVMMLMIREASSESAMAQLLWQDHLDCLDGENPEPGQEEKIKNRAKTTIQNLKTNGVIVEENGVLRFNL